MLPFLLLTTRPEDHLAAAEYRSFLRHGNLGPDQLIQIRLEKREMPRIALNAISGIMVGGSPFNSNAPIEDKSPVQRRVEGEIAELLDVLVPEDFPFLGACYGVGTLAKHQGGIIDGTYAEDAAAITINVTEAGLRDPLLDGVGEAFTAFVGHTEACSALPAAATLLASSDACPVQMFRVGENLYGTQFHPELDKRDFRARVDVYRHHGYFPPEEYERVVTEAESADTRAAHRVLGNFVARYAR